MTTNIRRLLALLLLPVLALVACGGGDSSSEASDSDAPTTTAADGDDTAEEPVEPVQVRIGVAAPISEMVLPWLGLELGIWEKHGIDMSAELIPGGTQIVAGMVGGSLEGGIFAAPSVQGAIVQGAEIKWVAEWIHQPNLGFVVQEGIESIEDLRGETLAISNPGTTTAIFSDKVLRENGLDPQRDVVQRVVGGQGEALTAFATGQVAGAIFGAPLTFTALTTPGAHVLVDYTEEYVWPYSGLALSESFLDDNPEAAVRLLEALIEVIDAFKTNPELTKEVIARETNTADPALVDQAYELAASLMDDSPIPDPEASEAVVEELVFTLPAADGFDASLLIDDTYIKRALGES
jgi:NitT/TauT family transport system substrate-binding protein